MKGSLENFSSQNLALSTADKLSAAELSEQVNGMLSFVQEQKNAASIPQNYEQYGKHYYIHNHALLSYFNSISPGFVSKMNKMLENSGENSLKYDDRPILFKVIYPQKMEELESIATKNVINSDAYPLNLKLKIEEEADPIVEILDPYIELEFFDPDMLDRDSISVKYNNEYILQDKMIWEDVIKFRFDISSPENHTVIIEAKNHGIIPPNTIGFKYRFNGKGKKKFVKSRLEKGEVVELELSQ